jgi:hypothetical protein
MGNVTYNFSVTLDSDEFIKVEDHIFTTKSSLKKEEHKIDIIGYRCLQVLKDFEDSLTMNIVNEWLLTSRALDQTCSFHAKWDDHKILEELIAGRDHPLSWYVKNCHLE